MFYFSQDLVTVLKKLDERKRPEIVRSIRHRLKCVETYKALTLLFGIFGLHRLYLNEKGAMILRLNYLTACAAAAVSGLYFANYAMLGVSLGLGGVVAIVWLYDVLTPSRALQRYHRRIEHRVFTWARLTQKPSKQ